MDEAFLKYKKRMITTNIVTSVILIFILGPILAGIWVLISFPLIFWYLNKKSNDAQFINNLKDENYSKKPKKMFRYIASGTSTIIFGLLTYYSIQETGLSRMDMFGIIISSLFFMSLIWLLVTIFKK